jgi:glycosyltransferase involved in cell wall biosynthesis
VHIHGIGPAVFTPLLRAFGLRVVVTHHGHDYDAAKWGSFARYLLRTGERMGVSYANSTICVSDTIGRDIERDHQVRCYTIYNGIPENVDLELRPELPVLSQIDSTPYLLIVGRITQHKQILDVIAALEAPRLEAFKLVVCGSLAGHDPYIQTVKEAARTNSRIVLTDYVQASALPWLYNHASCTVMASSYEGMPFVVLEALACGTRVLLSDIDAHRELKLPSEHYFRVYDTDHLQEQLIELIERDEQTGRAGANQILDARFHWDDIAKQTAVVFKDSMK